MSRSAALGFGGVLAPAEYATGVVAITVTLGVTAALASAFLRAALPTVSVTDTAAAVAAVVHGGFGDPGERPAFAVFALLGSAWLYGFLAVSARRLRDAGRSASWLWLAALGMATLFVVLCLLPSRSEEVRADASGD